MVLSWVEKMSSFILSSNSDLSPFISSQMDVCPMWEKLDLPQRDAVKDWMRELQYKIDIIDIALNKLGKKSLFIIEENGPIRSSWERCQTGCSVCCICWFTCIISQFILQA